MSDAVSVQSNPLPDMQLDQVPEEFHALFVNYPKSKIVEDGIVPVVQKPRYIGLGCIDSRYTLSDAFGTLPGQMLFVNIPGNHITEFDPGRSEAWGAIILAIARFSESIEGIVVMSHYGCSANGRIVEIARKQSYEEYECEHASARTLSGSLPVLKRHFNEASAFAGSGELKADREVADYMSQHITKEVVAALQGLVVRHAQEIQQLSGGRPLPRLAGVVVGAHPEPVMDFLTAEGNFTNIYKPRPAVPGRPAP
jgi:carbonic anhydrase